MKSADQLALERLIRVVDVTSRRHARKVLKQVQRDLNKWEETWRPGLFKPFPCIEEIAKNDPDGLYMWRRQSQEDTNAAT